MLNSLFFFPIIFYSKISEILYSIAGFEFLPDDHDFDMLDYSDSDEDRHALVTALRKFLVLVFFLGTVLVNWGQPIVIAAKITLILYTTKPSPFSVYLVVEQVSMQPFFISSKQDCFSLFWVFSGPNVLSFFGCLDHLFVLAVSIKLSITFC